MLILDDQRNSGVGVGEGLGAHWGGVESFMQLFRRAVTPELEVLEIGCGGGRMTRLLASEAAHVTAMDVSRFILDEARQQTADSANINFGVVDGFGDNLPTAAFDVVASHDVFVHFEFDGVMQYAMNIHRALMDGGAAVISVYTFDSALEQSRHCDILRTKGSYSSFRARRMPIETYRAIFRAAGFSIEQELQSSLDEYVISGDTAHTNLLLRRLSPPGSGSQ